jgi:hypothetical protein
MNRQDRLDKLKQIAAEMTAYSNAIWHDDGPGFDAKAAHVDELLRERMRTMGLPEDEIAKIEQESEEAVDKHSRMKKKIFCRPCRSPWPVRSRAF